MRIIHKKQSILLLATVVLALSISGVRCKSEKVEYCMQRTGLGSNDVSSIKYRNENCTVDCIMRQGVVLSYHVEDGTPCFKDDYRCVLGFCRDPESQKIASFGDLYSLDITILSAFVPDMDDLPGAGGSDVFVTIETANDGFPTYKKGEIICYTYVIQDNNHPRWSFTCKPLPLTADTKLRFRALDSDKPFSLNPDRLGVATEDVTTLMAKGRTKLRLLNANEVSGSTRPYYLEVEVKGSKYDKQ